MYAVSISKYLYDFRKPLKNAVLKLKLETKNFTENMSMRYSDDFAKMVFTLEPINALSTPTQLNTLVIFYLQQV